MNTATLLDHLRTHSMPPALSRAGVLTWDDAEFHRAAYDSDPETYLLLALTPGVHEHQRARVLLQTLTATRTGLDQHTRMTLDKATRALLFALAPNQVITVLLTLRRRRLNHKHVTRAILTFVLDHPDAELLIAARRPALRDCFEHALGKATARGCVREIIGGNGAELRRKLLRFSVNPAVAVERVRQLYAPGTHGVPVLTEPIAPLEPTRQREPIVTVTNRGDIAATLVHAYRGDSSAELRSALAGYVAAAADGLPRLAANVALVLDTSDSMRGYGEREWALLSQAEALRLVLARLCEHLTVIEAGAAQTAPTDLATALLDALAGRPSRAPHVSTTARPAQTATATRPAEMSTATRSAEMSAAALSSETDDSVVVAPSVRSVGEGGPDLVVIVTDGYENRMAGDLARVVATLPRIGVDTPIVLCQTTFTGRDDLSLRDPAPALPRQRCWHQDDFAALLPWMFVRCPAGADWIIAAARAFLDEREGVLT
ncbi:hypothetical protein ACFVUS_36775 [Nocardia sp. NPDC058058]|uniref:hypothetical protein n=1 Tax=Nocardia sp. NPDC058058 TaxID=3346317 RepID=UPI0036D98117